MPDSPHLVINGLSIGSGGGYTVARELFRGIGAARPSWRISLELLKGYPLHHEFEGEDLPDNCTLHWAPEAARPRVARLRYERGEFLRWIAQSKAGSVMMLNGQTIPGCPVPVFSHNQDPWPYRPEAWNGWKERAIAFVKRREHKRGMRGAAVYGWTSNYLRELICAHHGIRPRVDDVFYNGLPETWINRARTATPVPIADRVKTLVTVSNVSVYKRQDLVIRALAELRKRPGLEDLRYCILGHGDAPEIERLRSLAASLGVQDAVDLEGRVPQARVEEAMATSRAFVLMSVCESFGIPAIEAMTFGTPVVVSDCCAHPEVCADAAALVREDDLAHLVESLARVVTDDAESETLARKGLDRAQDFKWSTTVEKMLTHLGPLLERGGSMATKAPAAAAP